MDASIKLIRFGAQAADLAPERRQGWPLTVQAQGLNMPSEIFVLQAVSPNEPIPGDVFRCIASLSDLYEIPRGQGQAITRSQQIPFYRAAQMDFVCRSAKEAETLWVQIQLEVKALVDNFNSANNLVGVEFATIGATTVLQSLAMNPPNYRQLYYQPAGTSTFVNNVQGITNPDSTLPGWLPAASAPAGWLVPPGAFLFYNLALDPLTQAVWPPADPMQASQLYRNGILLPYGITHVFTKDTIWWLKFIPATLPGYERSNSEVPDANCPWPIDYISPMSPGDVSPIFSLTVFK